MIKAIRMLGPCTLLAGLIVSRPACGQPSLLQRLQDTIKDGAGALVKPAPQIPVAGTPYVGLVVDDAGDRGQGVRVVSVRAGGPAQQAGILPGDVLTRVQDNPVRSMAEMAQVLTTIRPGDRLVFHLQRNGKPQTVTVTVTGRSDAVASPSSRTVPPDAAPAVKPLPLVGATDVEPQAGTDRNTPVRAPLLGRVEGMIERMVRPGEQPAAATVSTADLQRTVEALRAEVQRLQQQLTETEKRLQALEDKLDAR